MTNAFEIAAARRGRARRQRRGGRRYSRHATPLLAFMARHRTALANHVQRQFPDLLPIDRTARLHLQTLVAHGDLACIRQEGIGRPNVYLITPQGLRAVEADETMGKRKRPTGSHVAHELLITEIAVSAAEATRLRPDVDLLWQDRFGFARRDGWQHLVPDYGFLFRHTAGRLLCLVEVSCGEESATRLGEKLAHYADWADSNEGHGALIELYRRHGAGNPRPQFRLLFVVQNRRSGRDDTRLRQLCGEVLRQSGDMRARVWATTVANLAHDPSIDTPLWVRGRDLDAPGNWTSLKKAEQRRLLAAMIREAPRHSLFPPAGT